MEELLQDDSDMSAPVSGLQKVLAL